MRSPSTLTSCLWLLIPPCDDGHRIIMWPMVNPTKCKLITPSSLLFDVHQLRFELANNDK
jgi:hypothetical protein